MKNTQEKLLLGNKEFIVNRYLVDRKSPISIGREIGVSEGPIRNKLIEWNIPIRTNGESHRKYKVNEEYFNKVDTEEKAYFLGLLYADGTMNKVRPTVSISLQEQDKELLDKLQIALNNERPMTYIPPDKRFSGCSAANRIYIDSHKMCKQLHILGMYHNKSKTISFPTEAQVPKELHRHFIRGYFDGNGCIYTYSGKNLLRTTLILVSNKFLNTKVKEIVLNNTDTDAFVVIKANDITELRYCGLKKSISILNYIYKDAKIYMERKYKSYLEVLEFYNNREALTKAN